MKLSFMKKTIGVGAAAALLGLCRLAALAEDAKPDALAKAKAAEAKRVALCAKLAPAVGAFFQKATVGKGGGSGVVIDPRGYAVTNFHVAGAEHDLFVGLNDGRLYKARSLGIDPGGDIALVKLEGKPRFDFVTMGVSADVRIGDRCLATGNPFLLATDFQPTVTEGIVSGVHRFKDGGGATDLVYGDCLQINASINPGNSGGPLFDEAGRWIGINGLGGFRGDRPRINVGVGYAASVDQIKNFLEDLRSGQQCEHGTMNATVRDLDDEFDPTRKLVKIDAIDGTSVGWKAGLRLGDVVIEWNGVPVKSQNHFLTLISRLPVGQRVRLAIDRRREDATIGGKHNYDRVTVGMRLRGIPSGPEEGQWVPDPDLIAQEKRATLEAVRNGTLPLLPVATGFEMSGTRKDASGKEVSFRYFQKGPRARIELGGSVSATNGAKAWRKVGDGAAEDLPAAEADILEGTARALDAVLKEGGEADLTELNFTGGDTIDGRRCTRLETRDKSGRRRKLYFDVATGVLAGIATPAGEKKLDDGSTETQWVEERWTLDAASRSPRRIERVDDKTGDFVSLDTASPPSGHAIDDSLFERGGDK
ncbi:trypsin-like peptidase domain-containing protein [bacterium]|nr:trypsin-like peptidase domain-containing protein [bacterium]